MIPQGSVASRGDYVRLLAGDFLTPSSGPQGATPLAYLAFLLRQVRGPTWSRSRPPAAGGPGSVTWSFRCYSLPCQCERSVARLEPRLIPAQSLSPGSGDQRRMSLHQTYVKSRVGHALQGRAALGRRRVDESMPMRLKQVRTGRPAPICRRRRAAFSNLQPRDPSRGACSPSRAFRAAPRAVVGLKRGGGGVVHPCIGHAESVVASRPPYLPEQVSQVRKGGRSRGPSPFP